jgi:hypothetical protein
VGQGFSLDFREGAEVAAEPGVDCAIQALRASFVVEADWVTSTVARVVWDGDG